PIAGIACELGNIGRRACNALGGQSGEAGDLPQPTLGVLRTEIMLREKVMRRQRTRIARFRRYEGAFSSSDPADDLRLDARNQKWLRRERRLAGRVFDPSKGIG